MVGRRRPQPQRERVSVVPLELPGAVLTHPFGDDVDVYKVGVQPASSAGGRLSGGKMFCLVSHYGDPGLMTLKVDPDHGAELVRNHAAITPGYHTNKRHWISVILDGSVDDGLLRTLVEDAYDLVVSTLSARARFDVDPDRFPLPLSRSHRA
jgi:predicted DNA-binding protein (MmcQ/YjbR family)